MSHSNRFSLVWTLKRKDIAEKVADDYTRQVKFIDKAVVEKMNAIAL